MTMWAILGAFSIPILIGIYFLRNRYPQKKVSSLLLWDFPEFKMRKGINKNKFLSERSFWLELITLLIFLVLLFQIVFPFFKNKQQIVYVLDNHYSLQAKSSNGSKVFEDIKKEILAESKNQNSISVIVADQYPKLMFANLSPDESAFELIRKWVPTSMSFDWQLTKVMLTEISDTNTRVIIYSDRPLLNQSYFAGFELRLRGAPQDNYAFINGAYSSVHEMGHLQALVKGIPKDPSAILPKLKVTIRQNEYSKVIELPNKENTNFYSIETDVPSGDQAVEIQLNDDALEPDNILHFEPAPKRFLKVSLQIKNKDLYELMLKTIRIFDEIVINDKIPDVMVSDSFNPTLKIPQIILGLPNIFTEGESKDVMGNVILQKDFSFLKDMQPQNIRWRGCKKINAVTISYLYSAEFPIFGKLQNFDQEVFFWNADLVKSDFRHLQDWPIFWENFKNYFIKNIEGLKYTTLMGSHENYLVTSAEDIDIKNPNNKSFKINVVNRLAIIPPFTEKGEYYISEKEKEVAAFYVNYLDLEGMDLRNTKTTDLLIEGSRKESQKHVQQIGNSHLLILMLILMAIGIYCFNLYLDHRLEGRR